MSLQINVGYPKLIGIALGLLNLLYLFCLNFINYQFYKTFISVFISVKKLIFRIKKKQLKNALNSAEICEFDCTLLFLKQ